MLPRELGWRHRRWGSPCGSWGVDVGEEHGAKAPLVLFNPAIEAVSEETEAMEEGCLSLPELRETVVRPAQVQVRYLDPKGRERRLTAQGLLARVLQHELDHLEGIYFVNRLSPLKRALLRRRLERIARGEVLPDYPFVPGRLRRR